MNHAEIKSALRSGVIGSDNGAWLDHAAADYIEQLETALDLAQEVAHDWLMDWSDFDGRVLRDQMADLLQVAIGSLDAETYRMRQGWPKDGAS